MTHDPEIRISGGSAPEVGHRDFIYSVCSISFFYALIIHITRTFHSVHLNRLNGLTVLDKHVTSQRTLLLITQLEIVLVNASLNK